MTAPDMVSVIEAALEVHYDLELEHRVWSCACGHEFGMVTDDTSCDVEHRAHQAAAVLEALTEAGTVEWATEGVEWDGRTIEHNTWPDEKTARSVNRKYGDRVVSRLTLPWERAE